MGLLASLGPTELRGLIGSLDQQIVEAQNTITAAEAEAAQALGRESLEEIGRALEAKRQAQEHQAKLSAHRELAREALDERLRPRVDAWREAAEVDAASLRDGVAADVQAVLQAVDQFVLHAARLGNFGERRRQKIGDHSRRFDQLAVELGGGITQPTVAWPDEDAPRSADLANACQRIEWALEELQRASGIVPGLRTVLLR